MIMKISVSLLVCSLSSLKVDAAFVSQVTCPQTQRSSFALNGYLDDISKDLYGPSAVPNVEQEKYENNLMPKEDVDRYGPGQYDDYVEFVEFDGGDGQVGVAGDGKNDLDKSDFDTGELASQVTAAMNKSKMRSARVAWGTSSGYREELLEKNPKMDEQRAQQLENWQNQQEIKKKKQEQRQIEDSFDQVSANAELDWRDLASFGVERTQDFCFDETFGEVKAGDEVAEVIDFVSRTGAFVYKELPLKNPYMGFADFRAGFTTDSDGCFSVTPTEGGLQSSTETKFIIKFKPDIIGTFTGYLVIETEDFKKTWKLIGSTGKK